MSTTPDARDQASLQERLDALLQQQRELVTTLQRGQAHFEQLARSVWRTQEEERRRLARELHDGIGQNLTAILRLLEQATASSDCSAGTRGELERVRTLVHSTLDEARALSRQLRPQILDDLGLAAALRWLARSFRDTQGLDVSLDLAEPLPALGGDAETLIFRVAQEGLNNVVKHAGATHAEISLQRLDERVLLSIRDDGHGCETSHALRSGSEGKGSGLGGMRDRAQLFGGQLRIVSQPGAGFSLEIAFSTNTGKLAP